MSDRFSSHRIFRRLRTYQPLWDRLIFGLSLIGVLVVTHLGIQQSRGFDRGCVGFEEIGVGGGAFDCASVLASGASTFLGLSNIVWGLGFYLAVAGLSFAGPWLSAERRGHAKLTRAGVVAAGLVYSAYLVYYQFVQLDQLCALCLASAGIVGTLALLVGLSLVSSNRSKHVSMTARTAKRELTLFGVLLALTVVLAGADLVYFSQLEPAKGAEECYFDPEKDPVENYGQLVGFNDPSEGNPDAAVTVIEFFDPNCPHCKTFHSVMKEVVDQYEDEAHFVYKPMPLWGYSVPQIEALYAADQEGKFMAMLEAQYARQQQGGLSAGQMRAIASEIGMNPDVLTSRLESQKFRDRVMAQRKQAVKIGVDSTPTVLVNGRFVASRSRTVECLGEFIESAQKQAQATDG